MNAFTSLIKRYPLAAFFIMTFILTEPMTILANYIYDTTQSVPLVLPIAVLGACPLLSALVVSTVVGGKTGLLALLRKFTIWRVGLRWYLIALLLQPVLNLAAVYINVLLGAPSPPATAFGSLSALLGTFAIRLVNPFSGPMLEELGWRGFAQPRLQQRYSPLTANLILAVLVTLWHLPLIHRGEYSWIAIPATMGVTIIYGWVYNATEGSVLLTLIMHATEPLLWVNFTGTDDARAYGIRVAIYALTGVIVALSAGKNLGRKESTPLKADFENAAAPV
ncbi:MAG: type II CAAX endopeptidase family protein [Chloroflexota bacterium]